MRAHFELVTKVVGLLLLVAGVLLLFDRLVGAFVGPSGVNWLPLLGSLPIPPETQRWVGSAEQEIRERFLWSAVTHGVIPIAVGLFLILPRSLLVRLAYPGEDDRPQAVSDPTTGSRAPPSPHVAHDDLRFAPPSYREGRAEGASKSS